MPSIYLSPQACFAMFPLLYLLNGADPRRWSLPSTILKPINSALHPVSRWLSLSFYDLYFFHFFSYNSLILSLFSLQIYYIIAQLIFLLFLLVFYLFSFQCQIPISFKNAIRVPRQGGAFGKEVKVGASELAGPDLRLLEVEPIIGALAKL